MLSWLEVRRSAQGCRVRCRTFVPTASIYPFRAGVGYVARLSFPRGECGRQCPVIQIEPSVRIATRPSRRAYYACRSCGLLSGTAPIMRSTKLLSRSCRAWCDLRKRCWLGLHPDLTSSCRSGTSSQLYADALMPSLRCIALQLHLGCCGGIRCYWWPSRNQRQRATAPSTHIYDVSMQEGTMSSRGPLRIPF
jgi:hypothetical protein